MNAVRRKPDEGNGRWGWVRAWPLVVTLAALVGWGYVTAYRVAANEAKIERHSEEIDTIKRSYADIDKKLSILIERQEWEKNRGGK